MDRHDRRIVPPQQDQHIADGKTAARNHRQTSIKRTAGYCPMRQAPMHSCGRARRRSPRAPGREDNSRWIDGAFAQVAPLPCGRASEGRESSVADRGGIGGPARTWHDLRAIVSSNPALAWLVGIGDAIVVAVGAPAVDDLSLADGGAICLRADQPAGRGIDLGFDPGGPAQSARIMQRPRHQHVVRRGGADEH